MPSLIRLPLRHVPRPGRMGIDEVDYVRKPFHLEIPIGRCALVLVDVWDRHHIASHHARCEHVVHGKIVPLVEAAREAGLDVVHAPGPAVAWKYPACPDYDRAAGDRWIGADDGGAPWPPDEFRRRQGEFAGLAPAQGGTDPAVAELREARMIAPEIEPVAGEAVVATGGQLAAELARRKKLVLLYAGFAANICVLFRDYGMRAMQQRGYTVALVRDATCAVEMAETLAGERLLEISVLDVEMNVGSSIATRDLLAVLAAEAG